MAAHSRIFLIGGQGYHIPVHLGHLLAVNNGNQRSAGLHGNHLFLVELLQSQDAALAVLLHGLLGHRIADCGEELRLQHLLPGFIPVGGAFGLGINGRQGEAVGGNNRIKDGEISGVHGSVALPVQLVGDLVELRPGHAVLGVIHAEFIEDILVVEDYVGAVLQRQPVNSPIAQLLHIIHQ
ncbi:hypothetical protein D3C75_739710 [compost metagenome]